MTPSASGRPKSTFLGGVGGRGVVGVVSGSGCRVGVGVLFRGRATTPVGQHSDRKILDHRPLDSQPLAPSATGDPRPSAPTLNPLATGDRRPVSVGADAPLTL